MQTQYIALAWFLILITVGVIIVLSIAIVVKRGVARRKSRIDRNVYMPCGYGLSKVWRETVERRLNGTVRVRTEPPVLSAHYSENWESYMENEKVTFLFRAKALDEFLQLKDGILHLCPDLEPPAIRGIHAFLMTARECAMNPVAPRGLIEEYCHLYLWARHDLNPFGDVEYQLFSKVHNNLMQYVSRAAALRNSSHPSTPATSYNRRNSLKPFGSRATSNSKSQSSLTRCSDGVAQSQSRLSMKSEMTHANVLKSHSKSQITHSKMKHVSHTHRPSDDLFAPSIDPRPVGTMSSKDSRATYECELDHSEDIFSNETTVGACGSRRGSCQSDGSQTALINFDPQVRTVTKGACQVVHRSRSNEAFETIELRPMLHHKDEICGNVSTPSVGLENESIGC